MMNRSSIMVSGLAVQGKLAALYVCARRDKAQQCMRGR